DHPQRMLQGIGHWQAGKIDQHRAHRSTGRKRPDNGPKPIAKTGQCESIINEDAAAESEQQWRHLGRKPPRIPHDSEREYSDKKAERPCFSDNGDHSAEPYTAIKAQHVAEL